MRALMGAPISVSFRSSRPSRDLVDGAVLFARRPHDPRDVRRVNRHPGGRRMRRRDARRFRRAFPDEIDRRLHLAGEIGGLPCPCTCM